jgi:hypothetical protein
VFWFQCKTYIRPNDWYPCTWRYPSWIRYSLFTLHPRVPNVFIYREVAEYAVTTRNNMTISAQHSALNNSPAQTSATHLWTLVILGTSYNSLVRDPRKTRVTCYKECVFTALLPSNGSIRHNIVLTVTANRTCRWNTLVPKCVVLDSNAIFWK